MQQVNGDPVKFFIIICMMFQVTFLFAGPKEDAFIAKIILLEQQIEVQAKALGWKTTRVSINRKYGPTQPLELIITLEDGQVIVFKKNLRTKNFEFVSVTYPTETEITVESKRLGPPVKDISSQTNPRSDHGYDLNGSLEAIAALEQQLKLQKAEVANGRFVLANAERVEKTNILQFNADTNSLIIELGSRLKKTISNSFIGGDEFQSFSSPVDDTISTVEDYRAAFKIPKNYKFIHAGLSKNLSHPDALPILVLVVESANGKFLAFRAQLVDKSGKLAFRKIGQGQPRVIDSHVFSAFRTVQSAAANQCLNLFK